MTEPAPSAPDSAAARSWVWHATVASRAAGKVSVLACVETLLAVVLYWWIAIHWDTHWHLLSSVFIAPLLLLRSPESIKLGVRWFMKNWLGFKDYKEWPMASRLLWLGGVALLSGIPTYAFGRWLCSLWLVGQSGDLLFYWLAVIGCVSVAFAVAIELAFKGAGPGACVAGVVATIAGIVAGVLAVVGVGAAAAAVSGLDSGLFSGVAAVVGMVVGAGSGLSLRGLFFRVAATLRHLPQGLRHLAENWQENNFWVDSCVPAEIMPGIREVDATYAFDGFVCSMRQEKNQISKWMFYPLVAVCFFLPAFLYRLNIKATCWFWWPLAYLLKPVPKADKASAQKQALCWPWDDPWQRLLIFVPAVLMCAVLIDRYSDFEMWQQYKNADAVPVPLKLILGMQWSHMPPWHVAMVFIASSGLGMLAISGAACSHKRNDNWDSYAQSGMSKHLWLMNALTKVRSLATGTFLILGLGMCLISFPEWRQWVPDAVMLRMDRFYHAQTAW